MKLGGNRSNTSNSGSRCSNWNNYVWNTNWNIGTRFACEHLSLTLIYLKGYVVRLLRWSAYLSYESKYIKRSVKLRVKFESKRQHNKEEDMGKKYKNLFDSIVDIDNLRLAYKKTVNGGNRFTTGHLRFKEHKEANLLLLQQKLISNTYQRGEYHCFEVYEPKKRVINALPFKDRVVQHAINNIIEPIFEKTFYSCSYACRKNKGTHKGVKAVQSTIRRMSQKAEVYYLKMDFSKYFYSIDKQILFKEIKRKISDTKLLLLLENFDSDREKGLPIGNLTSQLFANIYGHIFDRFIKTRLRVKYYFRYMDDSVILSHDKKSLKRLQRALRLFAYLFMKLKFSKWSIEKVRTRPLNFLGYRITADYKLIRKDSAIRAKRKIKRFTKLKQFEQLRLFLSAWLGHVQFADCFNLLNKLKQEMKICVEILMQPKLRPELTMKL